MKAIGNRLRDWLRHDTAPGVLLVLAAALAMALDNSPLAPLYDALLNTPVGIRIGAAGLDKPLLLWINDGMMAVFFCLVGLELKRESLEGQLASWRRASLPAIGAVGGMAVPALVYWAINRHHPEYLAGWAIPSATDIAFALGVLSLLGNRVPAALKVFLLALATLDDLGAIVVIAIFYTADLSTPALGLASAGLAGLTLLNRFGIRALAPYVLVGIFTWACVLESGVHATLAGVALGLAMPLRGGRAGEMSPVLRAEHALSPWVRFGILPLFAFANAGLSLSGIGLTELTAPLPLGIAAGLFLGKQIGIVLFAAAAVALGMATMPTGVSWRQFHAVSVLGGIGFTMSLFIGTLAFPDPGYAAAVRLGVLTGSLASAVLGYLLLRAATRRD
ncbi:MAG: Na+/H+ antiporter NhaA [Alphaproteobacteria bacterium]|nr:Na+/H+ antiporter NhaA [Alphaproteobacteria bacterium]